MSRCSSHGSKMTLSAERERRPTGTGAAGRVRQASRQRRDEQHRALHREQVDERHDAPLREHREGEQQQQRGAAG